MRVLNRTRFCPCVNVLSVTIFVVQLFTDLQTYFVNSYSER